MKENKYDDEQFFEKYSQMNRSQQGLKGAGEWSELQKVLPSFQGKRVLDLGCGYGWHCLYAAENGASSVLGVDISEKMVAVAEEKNGTDKIAYQCSAMEDLEFPEGSFDIVLSSLAFHYIKDFELLVKRIRTWLAPGGTFVFSAEHPVFTSHGTQDWYYNAEGEIMHFPVDRYFYEGGRDAIFLGEHVVKYHRTLSTYINTLLVCGFELEHVIEPQPPKEMLHITGMKDEMRRPMMLIIKGKKKPC